MTIDDVDFDGAIAQNHNSTGHSTWAASNPYNQFCQHANPLPASAQYGVAPIVPKGGPSDAALTVTSAGRAYLSRSMGFTTPDYSSATPYSSGQRGVRDYCNANSQLVHSKTGPPNQIGCTHSIPYDPLCGDVYYDQCGHLQSPYDPFGLHGYNHGGLGGGGIDIILIPIQPPRVPNIVRNYTWGERVNVLTCGQVPTQGASVAKGEGWSVGTLPNGEVTSVSSATWENHIVGRGEPSRWTQPAAPGQWALGSTCFSSQSK